MDKLREAVQDNAEVKKTPGEDTSELLEVVRGGSISPSWRSSIGWKKSF